MWDQFFSELGIPEPAFHLGIGGGSHGANTGRMLEAIERVLLAERPDAVLVYGDTDFHPGRSSGCQQVEDPGAARGGGAAFVQPPPAGRAKSGAHRSPTWRSSALPTDTAVAHLQREGIPAERIVRTGDVMADAARIFGEVADARVAELLGSGPLQGLGGADQPFVLATIHRAVNTDDPRRLEAILTALGQ